MLKALPLMIVPFALYNVAMFGFIGFGGPEWLDRAIFSVGMVSGVDWSMDVGDALIVIALMMLFVEILKATRTSRFQVLDHLLSLLVFIVFLVEFLLFSNAATDVFFILMAISFIDVVSGLAVSIRSASRDVSIGL